MSRPNLGNLSIGAVYGLARSTRSAPTLTNGESPRKRFLGRFAPIGGHMPGSKSAPHPRRRERESLAHHRCTTVRSLVSPSQLRSLSPCHGERDRVRGG